MAVIIVTVILSIILILALIDAGLPEYRIRWFPGRKEWVVWAYDHFSRPILIRYDWETARTTILGPEVWSSDYRKIGPGHWEVEGCPVTYKFIDSQGRNRYLYRTVDGVECHYWQGKKLLASGYQNHHELDEEIIDW